MKKEACVKLYKSGKFYHAHSDDGRILHELLGYKYVEYKASAGFPENALIKVRNKLEEEKISYQIYEKDLRIDSFSGVNKKYNEVLERAYQNADIENRLHHVQEILDSCNTEDLTAIIDYIENGRWK